MENTFKLFNRDRQNIFLERKSGDVWSLNMDEASDYVREFIRLCYTADESSEGEYEFIDPPGGPFMFVGYEFPIGTVKAIWFNKESHRFEFKIEEGSNGK